MLPHTNRGEARFWLKLLRIGARVCVVLLLLVCTFISHFFIFFFIQRFRFVIKKKCVYGGEHLLGCDVGVENDVGSHSDEIHFY